MTQKGESDMGNGDLWMWLLLLGVGVLILFVPQWLSRRKRSQRLMEFEVGDMVITIGGIIGTLTALDLEENVAQLRIAEGVEIEVVPGALGRKLGPEEEGEEDGEPTEEAP